MAANKIFLFGPIALTNTLTTNLLNPPAASGGVNGGSSGAYIVLRWLQIVNKTSAAATFSFWIGATGANAAGTEFFSAVSVPANTVYPWSGIVRLDVSQFLVGGASANTTLSVVGGGEIGVA